MSATRARRASPLGGGPVRGACSAVCAVLLPALLAALVLLLPQGPGRGVALVAGWLVLAIVLARPGGHAGSRPVR